MSIRLKVHSTFQANETCRGKKNEQILLDKMKNELPLHLHHFTQSYINIHTQDDDDDDGGGSYKAEMVRKMEIKFRIFTFPAPHFHFHLLISAPF